MILASNCRKQVIPIFSIELVRDNGIAIIQRIPLPHAVAAEVPIGTICEHIRCIHFDRVAARVPSERPHSVSKLRSWLVAQRVVPLWRASQRSLRPAIEHEADFPAALFGFGGYWNALGQGV